MIPGTDQTSNKPGKTIGQHSLLNPMHSEPIGGCSNSSATGTARPKCPLFAASLRYCAQCAWVGGRNMFVGPCASGAAVGAKGH